MVIQLERLKADRLVDQKAAIGLTAAQEAAIVAFMRTLDDGYTGVTQ